MARQTDWQKWEAAWDHLAAGGNLAGTGLHPALAAMLRRLIEAGWYWEAVHNHLKANPGGLAALNAAVEKGLRPPEPKLKRPEPPPEPPPVELPPLPVKPKPAPKPEPVPEPVREPEPLPPPAPEPAPVPIPEPAPMVVADPEPDPEPVPAPAPKPEPVNVLPVEPPPVPALPVQPVPRPVSTQEPQIYRETWEERSRAMFLRQRAHWERELVIGQQLMDLGDSLLKAHKPYILERKKVSKRNGACPHCKGKITVEEVHIHPAKVDVQGIVKAFQEGAERSRVALAMPKQMLSMRISDLNSEMSSRLQEVDEGFREAFRNCIERGIVSEQVATEIWETARGFIEGKYGH